MPKFFQQKFTSYLKFGLLTVIVGLLLYVFAGGDLKIIITQINPSYLSSGASQNTLPESQLNNSEVGALNEAKSVWDLIVFTFNYIFKDRLVDREGKSVDYDPKKYDLRNFSQKVSKTGNASAIPQERSQRTESYSLKPGDEFSKYLMSDDFISQISQRLNYTQKAEFNNYFNNEVVLEVEQNGTVKEIPITAKFAPYVAFISSLRTNTFEQKRCSDVAYTSSAQFSSGLDEDVDSIGTEEKFILEEDTLLGTQKNLRLPIFKTFACEAYDFNKRNVSVFSGQNEFISKSYDQPVCFDLHTYYTDNRKAVSKKVTVSQSTESIQGLKVSRALDPGSANDYSEKTTFCFNHVYSALSMILRTKLISSDIFTGYDSEQKFYETFEQNKFLASLENNGLDGTILTVDPLSVSVKDNNKTTLKDKNNVRGLKNEDYLRNSLLSFNNLFRCSDLSITSSPIIAALDKYYANQCSNSSSNECQRYKDMRDFVANKVDCVDNSKSMASPTVTEWCKIGLLTSPDCLESSDVPEFNSNFVCAEDEFGEIVPTKSATGSGTGSSPQVPGDNSPPNPADLASLHKPLDTIIEGQKIHVDHPAYDLSASIGRSVYSVADATCVFADITSEGGMKYFMWDSAKNDPRNEGMGGFGRGILLEHSLPSGKKFYSAYAHLSEISSKIRGCNPGQQITIKKGEVIGKSGNSGNSLGPHLHFEIRLNRDAKSFSTIAGVAGNYKFYGTADRCDPNYCSPLCIFENRACNFVKPGSVQGISDSNTAEFQGTPLSQQQSQCQPITQSVPPSGSTGSYTDFVPETLGNLISVPTVKPQDTGVLNEIPSYIKDSCPAYDAMVGVVTKNPLLLETVKAVSLAGDSPGDTSTAQIFGNPTRYPNSIVGIARRVSEVTGTPSYKLLAQLVGENCGVIGDENIQQQCKRDSSGNIINPEACGGLITKCLNAKYNGNLNQRHNSSPNKCGCVGATQFCPSGMGPYFLPDGKFYKEVRECSIKSGINVPDGEIMNPAVVGNAVCGTAIYLKYARTNEGEYFTNDNWDEGCCDASGKITFDSCRHWRASESYLGASCNRDDGVGRGCFYVNRTSNVCKPDTIISLFRDLKY